MGLPLLHHVPTLHPGPEGAQRHIFSWFASKSSHTRAGLGLLLPLIARQSLGWQQLTRSNAPSSSATAPQCDFGKVISPPCLFLPLCAACPTSSCDRPRNICCVFGTYPQHESFLVLQQHQLFVNTLFFFPHCPSPNLCFRMTAGTTRIFLESPCVRTR